MIDRGMSDIIFETDRLFLRKWTDMDVSPFAEMNQDERVMEYFPRTLSYDETLGFYNRIIAEFAAFGFGLYAVELKNRGKFIGYVGFHKFDFDAWFSPGVEIGWRLAYDYWNKGYATEAAKGCLAFARERKMIGEVYSFTASCNHRSERVMQKIGLEPAGFFLHPSLPDGHHLKEHVLYHMDL